MTRQHKIWIDVSGGSGKSFGCGSDESITLTVCVGNSSSNSRKLTKIEISRWGDSELEFEVIIDGQFYRSTHYYVKTKEFDGIKGKKINGNPLIEKRKEKKKEDSALSGLRTLSAIMGIGKLIGGAITEKEDNNWKVRMLKAGIPEGALHMPDDWDQLSEEEKAKRLDRVIKVFQEKL
jgi:hypothetical protein